MDVQAVERSPGAFQEPVPAAQIEAMLRRAFGDGARATRAVEIGIGTYNSTYRLEVEGGDPVILRVAPDPSKEAHGAHDAMRNEHAAAPYFATLGPLVPRTLAVDFTHQLIGRDYMIQTVLAGVPAVEGLDLYARPQWAFFYRQLGAITRAIHEVRGGWFGQVAGPGQDTWSQALIEQLLDRAAAVDDAGLDSGETRRVIAAAEAHRSVLDDITEPRLLHGDLWQLNVLIDPAAAEPTITGVLDCDSATWGDPLADWTIHQARQRRGSEVDAFWESYGTVRDDEASEMRQQFYLARNLIGARLDMQRRGIKLDDVAPIHWDLGGVLSRLG